MPYPAQASGTESLIEFPGNADGTVARRLARLRADTDEPCDLWHQPTEAMPGPVAAGRPTATCRPDNLLVEDRRLVVVDLPQVVDVVSHPQGPEFLARNGQRIGEWSTAMGLPAAVGRPDTLLAELRRELGMRGGTPTSQR